MKAKYSEPKLWQHGTVEQITQFAGDGAKDELIGIDGTPVSGVTGTGSLDACITVDNPGPGDSCTFD